jgi:hypothetical protein
MLRPRVGAVWTCVVIVFSLTMVRASPAVAAGNGLAGKSSQQVVSIALAAGMAKGSVHFVVSGEFGANNSNGTAIHDQTKTEGREVDSGTGAFGNGTVLDIRGVAYIKGDAGFLYGPFTTTQASTYAGKWIALHNSDQGYSDFAEGQTILQGLQDHLPVAPYSRPVFTTLGGKKVVKIVGAAVASDGPGTTTAYVSAIPPYLPVKSVIDGAAGIPNGGSSTVSPVHLSITFSKWGEKVSLSPPSNPTSASSILSS